MSDSPLASLSLTHVHYNPQSQLSYICAWLALVPQALCVTYATLMWSSREAEVIMMFAGQMLCEGLNWVLKRWIKEERPTRKSPSPCHVYIHKAGKTWSQAHEMRRD
ncbi:hypothetical protein K431DRAFT_284274 [Polychaeton citri CBS 116435]|uniref:Dolichyldiphosphatase n=1 Tax=Polychaeton citri CBS 116435 TaxID=1314669 RepID=A0A9P4UQR1_9PEZI|nr:hypothetical protein K431DRAFT_284274 [Polychaeton citri CBS 116435]